MAVNSMPAIDAQMCSGWTQQQLDLYNAIPFKLVKQQVDRMKTWSIWNKLTKKRKWTPQEGDTLKAVRTEPSPRMRQFNNPTLLSQTPRKDVMDVREVAESAQLYRQRFESPVMNFYPDFVNFMSHVDDTAKDIMEKMEQFEDQFLRGRIFHMAPYAILCKNDGTVELVTANPWAGTGQFDPATMGKTQAWLAAQVPKITGTLSLTCLSAALNIVETDLRVKPFSGDSVPKDDAPMAGKYLLVTSAEKYNQFSFDPWLLNNKNCDFDVVNNQFRGSIFGRITTRLEDCVLRMRAAGDFVAPELRVSGGNPYNEGETVPNPQYTSIVAASADNCSPIEWGFLCGDYGYESIQVGPPPAAFTADEMPENFQSMFWNGQIRTTKNFLKTCVDEITGEVRTEANEYGEDLKHISQAVYGIIAKQRRNIIPIGFQRKRGQ